jgi:hypothetical protein
VLTACPVLWCAEANPADSSAGKPKRNVKTPLQKEVLEESYKSKIQECPYIYIYIGYKSARHGSPIPAALVRWPSRSPSVCTRRVQQQPQAGLAAG